MSTKRSYTFKQTCNWKMQVCLSMHELSVGTSHQRVKKIFIPLAKHINQMIIKAKCIVVFIVVFTSLVLIIIPILTGSWWTFPFINPSIYLQFFVCIQQLRPHLILSLWYWLMTELMLISVTKIKWSGDEVGHGDFQKSKMIVIWYSQL